MIRYLGHFRDSFASIAALAAVLAVSGLLPAAAVWCLSQALDGVLAGTSIRTPLIALLGVATLQSTLQVARSIATRTLGWTLVHRLRMAAHTRFFLHPPEGRASVGSRLAALSHEADEIQYGVSALVTAVRNPVAVISLGAAATWMAPSLAWRFALLAPILVLPAWIGGHWVRGQTRRWTTSRDALLTELQDQHAGLDTSRDLQAASVQISRAAALSSTEARARARLEWMRTLPSAAVQLAVAGAIVALLAWGRPLVAQGELTAGSLVGFAAAVALVQRPLTGLTEVWTLLSRSLTALARIDALLAWSPPATTPCRPGPIHLEEVGVPGRLDPLDLHIEPGEKIALVGPSGSGKSTLLAILAGHLSPTGVTRAPALLLRQDPWVFDRTIRENLLLGRPSATDEQLEHALDRVGLALERGLDGRAGERGRELSGGERQRLCLARALLADPAVLLLDEATSEVDPARARELAHLLIGLDATVVFASHDGHFAALANRIVTLNREGFVSDRAAECA